MRPLNPCSLSNEVLQVNRTRRDHMRIKIGAVVAFAATSLWAGNVMFAQSGSTGSGSSGETGRGANSGSSTSSSQSSQRDDRSSGSSRSQGSSSQSGQYG